MAISVTHSTVVVVPDDGTSPVGTDEWNAAHTLSMATSKILGRTTAGTGTVEELSGTQTTAMLDAVVGDTGTGGTKGLVPAPAAGDAAAGKFLKADGTFAVPTSGGTPGGASLTIQYNNASAFGGMSGTSWDDTNRSLTLTGATVTANKPVLDLTQTWNNGAVVFTGYKFNITNTASDSSSKALDVLVAGTTSIFTVFASGQTNCYGGQIFGNTGNISMPSGATLAWIGNVALVSDAAGILAQRNSTNAQTLRVYNTYTDASNYERHGITWSSNICYVKNENAGTGSARLMIPVTGSTTVASLPAAATAGAGARCFVTDANATTFLSTVAGGGANKVPVVSDGTNWLIG